MSVAAGADVSNAGEWISGCCSQGNAKSCKSWEVSQSCVMFLIVHKTEESDVCLALFV